MPSFEEIRAGYVADGYKWQCACGELYREEDQARACRKCRQYLEDHANREDPVDLSKDQ